VTWSKASTPGKRLVIPLNVTKDILLSRETRETAQKQSPAGDTWFWFV
jgi:hypothetical protein